jgi:hypothetical protein
MVEPANIDYVVSDKASTEAYLKEQGIAFESIEHEECMTIQDMFDKITLTETTKEGVYAKNLFYQHKKKKDQMWLVIAAHDTKIDVKSLEKKWATGSGNLR